MSDKSDTTPTKTATTPDAPRAQPIPAYVPEDFVPLWQWYQEHGKMALSLVCLAAILAAGAVAYQRHRESQAAKASEQIAANDTVDTLETTVKEYGGTAPGVAAKLKLAKAYYDAGRFDQALETYNDFVKQHASHPFVGTAQVGRGYALAALSRTDEALDAFRTFQKANPDHYLIPQVVLGEAGCLAVQGKKADAKALLEDLRAAHRDTAWDLAGKRLEGVIDRYSGTRPGGRSLFDQADALAPLTGSPRTPTVSGGTNGAPVIVR